MKKVIEISRATSGEVGKGLLRSPSGAWWLVTRRADTIAVRPLADGALRPADCTPSTLAESYPQHTFIPCDVLGWYCQAGEPLPGDVTYEQLDYWRALARRYDADPSLWEPPHMTTTALRRYYQRVCAEGAVATQALADIPRASSSLAALFTSGVEELQGYRNLREGWVKEEARTPMDAAKFARDVALRLSSRSLAVPEGLGYHFVARELAPLRATGAAAPGSGDGGIDAMLATAGEPRLPVIVEVKSAGDRGAYLALVQALTYASEVVTLHQRQRLAKFYEHFAGLQDVTGPLADIWIITERGKADTQLAATRAVAALMLRERAVAPLLRRVVFFELSSGDDTLVHVAG